MTTKDLQEDLRSVINRHSVENESNTPDYILAQFVLGVLDSYNQAVQSRDGWYGIAPRPGGDSGALRVDGG